MSFLHFFVHQRQKRTCFRSTVLPTSFRSFPQDGVVYAFKNLIGHHCEGDSIAYFGDFNVLCDNYRRNIKFYSVRYSVQYFGNRIQAKICARSA